MASDQAGHDAEVDVAARQHHAGHAGVGGRAGARLQRRHSDRAGALDVELGPLHERHHRVGDGVLGDGDDLVDPSFDQRPGDDAGSLDGDAVGERRHRARGRVDAGVGSARRGLHADHPHVGHERLDGDGDAARQPAPAERHDDARQVVEVLDQLESERALSGDDGGVVERVAERPAVLGGELLRRCHRVVERRPTLDDRRAVGLARLDLGDRRARWHEDVARDAVVAGGERHRRRVVAGAAGGDARLGPIAQRVELVHRAADLERPRPLEVLRLEHDRAAEPLRQRRRRHDRGVLGDGPGDLAGGLDVGERDGLHRATLLRPSRRFCSASVASLVSVRAPSASEGRQPRPAWPGNAAVGVCRIQDHW